MAKSDVYRTALQVSPEKLKVLPDSDLGNLMRALLADRARRCGSPIENLQVNTEEKAKDGGCDGWSEKPKAPDSWLGDANTCWQFKAGSAGQAAKLPVELNKPIPQQTLRDGGRFVVVAPGSANGKKGVDDRLEALKTEARRLKLPADKIAVIGSEQLASWCNEHPAIAAHYAGRPPGLLTLETWKKDRRHESSWQATPDSPRELEALQQELNYGNAGTQHLHIYGPPGVGKTRFALELCRNAAWAAEVVYFPQASDERISELIASCSSDDSTRLVVVADEVQGRELDTLSNAIALARDGVRLITVGHCRNTDPATPTHHVKPLPDNACRRLVSGWHPTMPPEHIAFVASFAEGYIKLARLAADAVAKNPEVDVRSILDEDGVRTFMDRMLGPGSRRSLHILAILTSVGWEGDAEEEGKVISEHLGLSWHDVRREVEDFDRRLGIAPRGGKLRYISPTPLGAYLAAEAWSVFRTEMKSLEEKLPTKAAQEAFLDRMKSIASTPAARDLARDDLAFFLTLGDFVDAQSVKRWSALSAADPRLAAKRTREALEDTSVEERKSIAGSARRELVSTLVALAWRNDSFDDATFTLALLGEAENEGWSNNASGEFATKFQVGLGGTARPFLQRLHVLDKLESSGRLSLRRLVLEALASATKRHEHRTEYHTASTTAREEEWHPGSADEHLSCFLEAITRLTNLADLGEAELERRFLEIVDGLAISLRERPVREHLMKLFQTLKTVYPDSREQIRRSIADIIDRERKYWNELSDEELSELLDFHRLFEGSSLHDRLLQFVGPGRFGEEPLDFAPLAEELLASETLAHEWQWLTSGEADSGWAFGAALAEQDNSEKIAELDWLLQNCGPDHRVTCGYVSARKRRDPRWFKEWYKTLAKARPDSIALVLEVAWRCGVDETTADVLTSTIRDPLVTEEAVSRLEYGAWVELLSPKATSAILVALIERDFVLVAVAILQHRVSKLSEEKELWLSPAKSLLLHPRVIRSGHMASYHWKVLAKSYLPVLAPELAKSILAEQARKDEEHWFLEHSDAAEILKKCVEMAPGDVWRAVASLLTSENEAAFLAIGFPKEILGMLPRESLLEWAEEQKDTRPQLLARLVPTDFAATQPFAIALLERFDSNEDVKKQLFGAFTSGSWIGEASNHWEELARELDGALDKSSNPVVIQWAKESAQTLRDMASRDRSREEEESLRGRG